MKIAVLGLGAMGLQMATWLAKTNDVTGYDIAQERLDLAKDGGVNPASSAKEAVDGVDIAIVAVRSGAQLDELLYGTDGIADAMKSGSAIILTSTIGIKPVAKVAAELRERGIGIVDAPVSGGPIRAGKGDLLVVCGAYPDVWEYALPVLNEMASTLVLVGDEPGDGQKMKTVNQLLCGVHIAAAGEALALAARLGLDQSTALDALMAGAAESFMLGDRGPRAIQAYQGNEAEVRSRLDIFVKDMGIVTDAAKSVGISVPVAAAAEQLYLQGLANGMAAMDDSSTILIIDPDKRK